MNEIYKNAFKQVKEGDPDYYDDVEVQDMMDELAKPKHVPWFQQAYDKYVEGQRFSDQIPGTRNYSGLTLGTRHQPTKFSELQRKDIHDQNRFLTKEMREQGYKEPPVMYVPRDEIDYYMQTGQLPKALAANAANADLNGIRVPKRQEDGTYVDAQGDIMTHEDMADYFARLRAAPAQLPPPPVAVAGPPAPPPIAQVGKKGKRRKVQQTLVLH